MLSSIYCLTYPNKLGDQTLSILVSRFAFSQCRFWYWLATVGWAEFSMCQIFVLASCIWGQKMTITSSRKQAPPVRYLGVVRRNTSDSPSNVQKIQVSQFRNIYCLANSRIFPKGIQSRPSMQYVFDIGIQGLADISSTIFFDQQPFS